MIQKNIKDSSSISLIQKETNSASVIPQIFKLHTEIFESQHNSDEKAIRLEKILWDSSEINHLVKYNLATSGLFAHRLDTALKWLLQYGDPADVDKVFRFAKSKTDDKSFGENSYFIHEIHILHLAKNENLNWDILWRVLSTHGSNGYNNVLIQKMSADLFTAETIRKLFLISESVNTSKSVVANRVREIYDYGEDLPDSWIEKIFESK